jgi:ADP-ribosylglycohydrolase
VGDALGVPLKTRRLAAPPFPQLTDGPYRELKGGGPFELRRGQVGESGQQACVLGAGLRELSRYDADDMLRRYLSWQGHAQGMSEATREVLTEVLESGMPKATAGRRVWLRGHRRVVGNGSLARTAPIGVFFRKDSQARIQASLADCALTHFDPRCQLACVALNGASDLVAAKDKDPMLYGPDLHLHLKPDHVRVAFRLAWWELVHAPSFEAGVVDAVNRGGDADANGAITGALLGAFHGEAAIPSEWREGVLEAFGPWASGPLGTTWHPRNLLLLAPD